jgi:hypothetical protein
LALIGPALCSLELFVIFTLPDLFVRPRTIPENQEVAVEEGEETAVVEEEDADDVEKLISIILSLPFTV